MHDEFETKENKIQTKKKKLNHNIFISEMI